MSSDYYKPGNYVIIKQSLEKELIGKIGIIKEVTKNSPRLTSGPFFEFEVLVEFSDIQERGTYYMSMGMAASISKGSSPSGFSVPFSKNYQKVFRIEHIAPPTMLDRLLYA